MSEISEWEGEPPARRGDGVFYAASAAEEGGGQHAAEEDSQLRGIERIDCEGE